MRTRAKRVRVVLRLVPGRLSGHGGNGEEGGDPAQGAPHLRVGCHV